MTNHPYLTTLIISLILVLVVYYKVYGFGPYYTVIEDKPKIKRDRIINIFIKEDKELILVGEKNTYLFNSDHWHQEYEGDKNEAKELIQIMKQKNIIGHLSMPSIFSINSIIMPSQTPAMDNVPIKMDFLNDVIFVITVITPDVELFLNKLGYEIALSWRDNTENVEISYRKMSGYYIPNKNYKKQGDAKQYFPKKNELCPSPDEQGSYRACYTTIRLADYNDMDKVPVSKETPLGKLLGLVVYTGPSG